MCDPEDALREYGITLRGPDDLTDLDGLVLAVPHAQFLKDGPERIVDRLKPGGVLVDVKSVIPVTAVSRGVNLWSL
jgi:UDP-N-acetyl-D-galactosamine dehydrogenase